MSSGVFRGVQQQVMSPNNISNANKDVLDHHCHRNDESMTEVDHQRLVGQ